ncbi:MAG: hypothetical protein GF334_07960 [Candidatus Altiarchaeales archaeon]|nr:hypothetical protein [Candidatus Altiarchaeales archaeon]
MSVRLLLSLSLLFLVGCASVPQRMPAEEAVQVLDALNRVRTSCRATHLNFQKGISPVDCRWSERSDLLMSFPNKELFLENQEGVSDFISSWCQTHHLAVGRHPMIQFVIREEGFSRGLKCKELVKLLEGEN